MPLAKQRRLSFICHNHLSKCAFDLIQCDIWGQYPVPTYNGHLVDDCTRFTWVYLMKHKSDAKHIIPKFFSLIETQFHKVIKGFKSNNAPKLSFSDFFDSRGVVHQFSCVERPEQNSVVEHKHQHLLNVATALYFQSWVLISFLGDCVFTVAFLINRLPVSLLQNNSLYQLLYNASVEYTSFRIFGNLCFASTLSSHGTKFHPRATTCVFISYPPGIKGHKLYDITTKTIFVSRDVFHEHIFPFHCVTHSNVV